VLLALETQVLLMWICFAGMFGFTAVAVRLMLGRRAANRHVGAQARARSASAPVATDVRRPASVAMPDAYEPTEFVALAHAREDDSPAFDERTAFVAPAFGVTSEARAPAQMAAPPDDEPPPEKTEFIPAPLRGWPSLLETSEPPREPTGFGRAPTTRPAPLSAIAIDLGDHLDLAADAFARIHAGATEPSIRDALAGHLAVLASVPAKVLLEIVQPQLAGAPDLRWSATLLALLHNESWSAKTALAPMLAAFDEPQRQAALQLLRSWDDPRGRSIAAAALASAQSSEQRAMWLSCFATRGWDPGADVIEAALADSDPAVLISGLQLLPRSDQAVRFQPRLLMHTYATHPSVRMQAIEGALTLGIQSAWLVCRQLARNPSFPAAAELAGLLSTEAELAVLLESLDAQATPQLLHGLTLSGRPAALRACIARFDDPDTELRAAARDGLMLAAGRSFDDAGAARQWVDGLTDAARWLGGSPRTGPQILDALTRANPSSRRALACELSIRSRARIHIDVTLLPDALARELSSRGEDVGALELERGFPWTNG
jgi:hypothetical protein